MLNILFPKKAPLIAGYSFDAVLEDTYEGSIELTTYPVESGVRIADHRIINPQKYFITGVIGSKPLKPLIDPRDIDFSDLIGTGVGFASNAFRNNPLISMAAGLSGGFLAGSDATRAATQLDWFIALMRTGMPFHVDAVNIQLPNMVITKISRTTDPRNETGVEMVMEIQELITLDRLKDVDGVNPSSEQLPEGDPAQLACTRDQYSGEKPSTGTPGVSTISAVKETVLIPTNIPPMQ